MKTEITTKLSLGQIVYHVDKDSVTAFKVNNVVYNFLHKTATYTLTYLGGNSDKVIGEDYLYESEWFTDYLEACTVLENNIKLCLN